MSAGVWERERGSGGHEEETQMQRGRIFTGEKLFKSTSENVLGYNLKLLS